MINFYFYSKQFLKLLSKHQELVDYISSISSKRKSFLVNPQTILNVPRRDASAAVQSLNKIHQNITNINSEILEIIRSKRPNDIYDFVSSLMTGLNLFDHSYNDQNTLIRQLKEFPEKHTDAYSDKQADQIFELAEVSKQITQSLNDVKEKSEFIIEEFDKSKKISPKNYSELRIGTDQDVSLISDFTSIIGSFQELYNFVCYIYKIDEKKNQLILNHVGTGSWYTEILGIKQVVISIENLLKGMGTFLRDLVTGKIGREKFENECKKTETFINLLTLAKKNGIDNAELGVFKSLKPLVDNFSKETTTIIINDEEILNLKEVEKLTLSERKTERAQLVESINLSLNEGENKKKEKKTDNK